MVADGSRPSIRKRTINATDASTVLTIVPRISAIGNTSRGAYTLFSSGLFTRLVPPPDTEPEKKVHGIRPTYRKIGYQTPPVSILVFRRLKRNVNTTIWTSGVRTAHANPRISWLYVARRSRMVRLKTIERERQSSFAPEPSLNARR